MVRDSGRISKRAPSAATFARHSRAKQRQTAVSLLALVCVFFFIFKSWASTRSAAFSLSGEWLCVDSADNVSQHFSAQCTYVGLLHSLCDIHSSDWSYHGDVDSALLSDGSHLSVVDINDTHTLTMYVKLRKLYMSLSTELFSEYDHLMPCTGALSTDVSDGSLQKIVRAKGPYIVALFVILLSHTWLRGSLVDGPRRSRFRRRRLVSVKSGVS